MGEKQAVFVHLTVYLCLLCAFIYVYLGMSVYAHGSMCLYVYLHECVH